MPHLFRPDIECLGDGLFDGALSEAELNRFVQWRDSTLEQVADFGNFRSIHLAEQVGQEGGELFAARSPFERFETVGEPRERQHR